MKSMTLTFILTLTAFVGLLAQAADDPWSKQTRESETVQELRDLMSQSADTDTPQLRQAIDQSIRKLGNGSQTLQPKTYSDLIALLDAGSSANHHVAIRGLVAETLATHSRVNRLTDEHVTQLLRLPQASRSGAPLGLGAQVTAIATNSRGRGLGANVSSAAITALEKIDDTSDLIHSEYVIENLIHSIDAEALKQDSAMRSRLQQWVKSNVQRRLRAVLAGQPQILQQLGGGFPLVPATDLTDVGIRRLMVVDRATSGFDFLERKPRGEAKISEAQVAKEIAEADLAAGKALVTRTMQEARKALGSRATAESLTGAGVGNRALLRTRQNFDAITGINAIAANEDLRTELLAQFKIAAERGHSKVQVALASHLHTAYPTDSGVSRLLIDLLGRFDVPELRNLAVKAFLENKNDPRPIRRLNAEDAAYLREKLLKIGLGKFRPEFRDELKRLVGVHVAAPSFPTLLSDGDPPTPPHPPTGGGGAAKPSGSGCVVDFTAFAKRRPPKK